MARPVARRFGRYSLVSVVNVLLGQSIIAFAFGVLGWTARSANLLACALATLPSILLNRAWVWGRTGRSRLVREAVPFWVMAFAGLALSTWTAGMAEDLALSLTASRPVQTVMVMAAVLAAFGVLWVARFAFLETYLFAERRDPVDAPA